MKKVYLSLMTMLAVVFSFAQTVSITTLATPYSQDFNTLANTGTTNANTTLPAGWLMSESGTSANTTYRADNGASNTGDTYSFGATGNTERALGGLQSGSVNPTIGAGFTNNSGTAITSITITYFGEQWRLGAQGRTDTINFQYSLSASGIATGTYIDVDALDFVTPNTGSAIGAIDGNGSGNRTQKTFTITGLNIPDGSTFYIRWLDANVSGADDGLSVDDFSMTFNGGSLPACATPTAQAGALSFSAITTTTMTVNFVAASPAPDQYLAVVSTSSSLGGAPVDGTTYSLDDVIGNGVVTNIGNTTSFLENGLTPGTTYYFFIFSVSSNCTGGPLYLTASPATGNQATTAPPVCAAPVGQVSNVSFTPGSTSISGSFTPAADADGYMVCISTNASLGFTPVNGTTYAEGATVGNGTVIKYGPGNTFFKNGLTASTTYYFTFFPLNQFACTGGPLYNATGFAASQATTAGGSGIPPTYYSTITTQTCAALKTELKNIVTNGMTPKSYSDLWTQYTVSDVKQGEAATNVITGNPYNNTGRNVIWDIYSDIPGANNDPYQYIPTTNQCGSYSGEGACYNREHSIPQNWFTGGTATGPGTDYHHIFPTDGKVNGERSNYIYGEVASATFTSKNGSKLGSSANAGFTGPVFEPINEYKGDLARAFLYFVTRYENNMPSWPPSGSNGVQAMASNTFPSIQINYLRLMLKWHNQDPVSQKEIDRNNAAYAYQGNRNPFIDHPEYADLVWNSSCPGLAALPVDLISFKGILSGSVIKLEWDVMNEHNLRGYDVERSVNGKEFTRIGSVNATNASTYRFNDDVKDLSGRRLYYRIKKVDLDGQFKYSEVFTIHVPLNLQFTVYPNPVVSDYVKLLFAKPTVNNSSIVITDMAGRTFQQIPVAPGTLNMIIDLKKAPAGMYMIRSVQEGNSVVQKIQVVK